MLALGSLKQHAIATSLFPPTTLSRAIGRLGFVQADPIRSPARAQDLILRHRVKGYVAGDIETLYPSLGLEEDYLYAYGLMPRSTWNLLHPRGDGKLNAQELRLMEITVAQSETHPRDLGVHFGETRERNAWGGFSKATTRMLHALHYRGFLRVAGRAKGIRLYQTTDRQEERLEPAERLRLLVLLIAGILAPLPDRSLREALRRLRYAAPDLEGRRSVVAEMIESGKLAHASVDGSTYLWPAGPLVRKHASDTVRFLAPFDPLVWDRRRFAHFWGWEYRFEAYTPPAKRKLGYYAMPMLWREDVVGWVNISYRKGDLKVEPGFVAERPGDPAFRQAFAEETERFRIFLKKVDREGLITRQ